MVQGMADASFAERLHGESERWVAEGLVTAKQASELRARYPLDRSARRSRAVAALASIGAVAVAVSVIGSLRDSLQFGE